MQQQIPLPLHLPPLLLLLYPSAPGLLTSAGAADMPVAQAGVCIGSEMSGGVSDVHVSDCAFLHCSTGIRVKSGSSPRLPRSAGLHSIEMSESFLCVFFCGYTCLCLSPRKMARFGHPLRTFYLVLCRTILSYTAQYYHIYIDILDLMHECTSSDVLSSAVLCGPLEVPKTDKSQPGN